MISEKKIISKKKSALHKLVAYLAVRDHTELELRRKLAKNFSFKEIDEALNFARQHKLLKTPKELAEQVYHELSRKNKGYLYIVKYLRTKGLPNHAIDREQELEKARNLVTTKLRFAGAKTRKFNHEEKIKIFRLLTNRGFDDQTIRTVAHEKQ